MRSKPRGSDDAQRLVWKRGKLNDNRIALGHIATRGDDCHDTGSSDQLTVLASLQNCRHQPLLKAIELNTRIAQAGELDDRVAANPEPRADREAQQIDTAGGDVLANIAGSHPKTSGPKLLKEFDLNQVHLAQIGLGWVPGDTRTMLHSLSSVRVTLDTVARDQAKARLARLTERVPRAQAQGDDRAGHANRIARPPPGQRESADPVTAST